MLRFNSALKLPMIAAAMAMISLPSFLAAQSLSDDRTAALTYADLADLADLSDLVVRAKIKQQIEVEPERAPGLQAGQVRLYIKAETINLLTGSTPVGESLTYLVDLPRTAKGKAPKLKKREVILFARPVAGSSSQLRLIAPDAQLMWSENLDMRLQTILREFAAPDARPAISGIRDALSIRGNLAGESETQIFLDAGADGPVSMSVIRRPGMLPSWGVSWSEIVDQAALPPQRNTLAWYRLACFLPASLPRGANLSRESEARARAIRDYQFIREQLGDCPRSN